MDKPAPSFAVALAELAAEWGVGCDEAQAGALRRYADLLLTWNERINLTGARTLEVLAADHLPDAFALAAAFPDPGARVIDVGSGGGLPAVPLALLRPGLRVTLVEPIAKKAAFLRTAIRDLDLADRTTVEARRAEAIAGAAPESFDAAISRATMAPDAWIELAQRLVPTGGRIFVLTSAPMTVARPSLTVRTDRTYLGDRRRLVELQRRA
jgi:16S rRNA (guanine527-N7)-methyltransferase